MQNDELNENSTEHKFIIVFTDGSYSSKTQLGGYGVYFPYHDTKYNISKPFKMGAITNQRCELYAIYKYQLLLKSEWLSLCGEPNRFTNS